MRRPYRVARPWHKMLINRQFLVEKLDRAPPGHVEEMVRITMLGLKERDHTVNLSVALDDPRKFTGAKEGVRHMLQDVERQNHVKGLIRERQALVHRQDVCGWIIYYLTCDDVFVEVRAQASATIEDHPTFLSCLRNKLERYGIVAVS